jgi:hypothetical protein
MQTKRGVAAVPRCCPARRLHRIRSMIPAAPKCPLAATSAVLASRLPVESYAVSQCRELVAFARQSRTGLS